jgi:hypothetical protein
MTRSNEVGTERNRRRVLRWRRVAVARIAGGKEGQTSGRGVATRERPRQTALDILLTQPPRHERPSGDGDRSCGLPCIVPTPA